MYTGWCQLSDQNCTIGPRILKASNGFNKTIFRPPNSSQYVSSFSESLGSVIFCDFIPCSLVGKNIAQKQDLLDKAVSMLSILFHTTQALVYLLVKHDRQTVK